ncbi:peroxisomal membrane protein 11C-like [Anopheles bellator]|uniref:peroxisomal membrane protein 11C-like n=1 Tax=Anopheles bellator TaxID=139047 RepID=UPI00264A0128|nr:peroxisomal membrane protein 11C-like [Anopheles bellator]
MSKMLTEICEMLDGYTGRDKIIRMLCYTTKLGSGLYAQKDPQLARKLAIFSTKMSETRATLRLFDDLPMLAYSLSYGYGNKEPDRWMGLIGFISNLIDHAYYPVDKVCWFLEHNLLNVQNPTKWDTINSLLWVASIYLNLMKTIRSFTVMEQHKSCIDKKENEASQAFQMLLIKQRMEALSILRLSLDLIHAGSTLPKGMLWGGCFQTWHVGLIGTVSSLMGLYQYVAKKRIVKQCS